MTAVLVAGSLWEMARFFFLIWFITRGLPFAAHQVTIPWLLAVASPGLALAAGWLMYALFPQRYARLVPLLRVGKLLGISTLVLLFLTGAIVASGIAGEPVSMIAGFPITRAVLVVGIMLLFDMVFLTLLFSLPADPQDGGVPGSPPS